MHLVLLQPVTSTERMLTIRRNILRGLLAFAALALGVPIAQASPITIPSGLNPGDTYYLAFVTAGSRDATSPLITDYDLFVTAQANSDPDLLALLTTWKVIGSTESVSAASHLGPISSPIYNLAGQLVATGSSDLFDGSLGAPIIYDQHGISFQTYVWTGSRPNGSGDPERELGTTHGTNLAMTGYSSFIDTAWILAAEAPQSDPFSMYGLSGPLVVPTAAVPEPTTISLMMGPALLLLGRYRPRRRRPATRTPPTDPAVH